MEPLWALGLMSGTSLDGVDAAWLLTDGEKIWEKGQGMTVPYPAVFRENLRHVLGQTEPTKETQELERALTLFHADVVKQAQKNHSFDLIGFHGQTVYHAPPHTWQLGDGKLLAQEVGIEVVYDFRSQDVAQGGQGAPLVPIFHQAMINRNDPVVIVNIGGVANLTWIHKGSPLIACDTGPGGALLDDWLLRKTGQSYDFEGQLAGQGIIDETIVYRWLRHPYFAQPAPKSLDRNDFLPVLDDVAFLSPADGAATLADLTVRAIVQTLPQMPAKPNALYVTGGGRHNRYLMQHLSLLAPCPVDPIEALQWNGDWVEAYAFAYLAARVKRRLPTSFPTTTGVKYPTCGGKHTMGRS